MKDRIPHSPPHIDPVPADIARPLWSVMIPVYNCYRFIPAVINSVLVQDQGQDRMQIEVVDDCSTDGDVYALVEQLGKGRVGYFRQQVNGGSLRNFETCINRSKGERIHILHGDDLVKPGFYAELDLLFNKFPEVGAAFTKCTHVDENGVEAEPWRFSVLDQPGIVADFLERAASGALLQPPSIAVKRKVYEELGSFYGAPYGEDWEMWVRIGAKYPVAYSPKCLALYRSGQSTNITASAISTGQNITDINTMIGLAQKSIPGPLKTRLKFAAKRSFSIHYAMASTWIYKSDKKAAFVQAKGALRMSLNIRSIYWVMRLYLLHLRSLLTK